MKMPRLNRIVIAILGSYWLLSSTLLEANEIWETYKTHFIQEDGRVVDRMNGNITHSEGVGYALFFSVAFNDKVTFDKIYGWMHNNLKLNNHGLYGWKWGQKGDEWRMLDSNNATDGDLWIAYALLKAAVCFQKPMYAKEALVLLENVRHSTWITVNDRIYLLPAAEGFAKSDGWKINLSYYPLFMFEAFAKVEPEKGWDKLLKDGVKTLEITRYTPFYLHPDWIMLHNDGKMSIESDGGKFGYEAIRIPLFLLGNRSSTLKNLTDSMLERYRQLARCVNEKEGGVASANLQEESISFKDPSPTFKVVFGLLNNKTPDKIFKEICNEKMDYYAFSLLLFGTVFTLSND